MRLCNKRPHKASTSLFGFRLFTRHFAGELCLPDDFFYGFVSRVRDSQGSSGILDLCYYQLRNEVKRMLWGRV